MPARKPDIHPLQKAAVNADVIVIYVAGALFLLRLYACRFVVPGYDGMDYYGNIELAKNIFHHLDFTVHWELGGQIQYPPFFSILIYLLTFLTKNFVTSIQVISIFCVSFYIVPLFSLVRNILNIYLAGLAVVFTTYYFGIQPCQMITMDFFYSFLIIVICWLVWDTLTNHSREAWKYVLAGVLISIADLTKYSGMLFGMVSAASVLYYFTRHQQGLKAGIKYCALMLIGAAPLCITYHLLLNNNIQKKTPDIASYAFFDGNYVYQKGWIYRDQKISELNSEGTEYAYTAFLNNNNMFDYILKHPVFVLDKYLWGLNKITQEMTFTLLPGGNITKTRFYDIGPEGNREYNLIMKEGCNGILREISSTEVRINPDYYLTQDAVRQVTGGDSIQVWHILQQSVSSRRSINFIFQGAFLFLLIASGAYLRWHFNLIHIFLYAVGMVLIPLCNPAERYLMPFMPLYFVLWLFILNAGYSIIQREIKDKAFLRNIVIIVIACLVFIYVTTGCKQISQSCRYFRQKVEQNEVWLRAAEWIKKDAAGLPQRAKIMAFDSNYLSFLTDSDYIRLPYLIFDWNKVINFAIIKKVNYVVISGDYVNSFRGWLRLNAHGRDGRIKMIHEIIGANEQNWVIKT